MTKKHLIIASCVSLFVGSAGGYFIGHKIATDFEQKQCAQHLKNFILGSQALQQQKEHEERVASTRQRIQRPFGFHKQSQNR